MKKSDFMVLVSYTFSLLVLALGICLYTLPGWGMPTLGLPLSILGLLLVGLTWVSQRRLAGKEVPRVNLKVTAKVLYSLVALLVFGGGFALVTAGNFLVGLALGLVGLIMILGMIPVLVGLKD